MSAIASLPFAKPPRSSPAPMRQLDRAIGVVIRERRKAAGLTQTQLGHHAGRTFQLISQWEHARRVISVRDLVRVADGLSLPAETLLGEIIDRAAADDGTGECRSPSPRRAA